MPAAAGCPAAWAAGRAPSASPGAPAAPPAPTPALAIPRCSSAPTPTDQATSGSPSARQPAAPTRTAALYVASARSALVMPAAFGAALAARSGSRVSSRSMARTDETSMPRSKCGACKSGPCTHRIVCGGVH
eukprot:scaffold2407_cov117-Isochrysis_galbana.AAC.3